jgi:hypothetical protein
MPKHNLQAQGKTIVVTTSEADNDFISLTDIARFRDFERIEHIIQNWMRNKDTLHFLGIWERINNPHFKHLEFEVFKKEAGFNSFSLTPGRWIGKVNAIGIVSRSGRYGGTFAHKDIAFEFASWISPEFKLYLIKEFQRLKVEENEKKSLDWNAKRMLTKINYKIHTDSIKEHIILPQVLTNREVSLVYASEADILNMALFGITAQNWKKLHPNKEGNIRDHADVYQLVCLSNLESINAEFINMNMSQQERILKLNLVAITQMKSLLNNNIIKKLL